MPLGLKFVKKNQEHGLPDMLPLMFHFAVTVILNLLSSKLQKI